MKKTILALLLAVIMILGMCPALAEEPTTVTFVSNNLGYEDLLQEYIDQWNAANPDLQVELYVASGSPDEYWTQLSTAIAGGNAYDIYMMSPSYFQTYIDNGLCYPLDAWFEGSEGWYDYALADVTRNEGHIWAYPAFNDLMAIYVNVDMLKECGIEELPSTYDEFITAASTVANELGVYGFQTSITFEGYGQFEWYPVMWGAGGDLLTGEEVITNKEGVVKALQFWRDMANSEGGCLDMACSADYFINELVCMMPIGQWMLNDINKNADQIDFEWTVIPYPVPEEGDTPYTVMGGWKYCVYPKGKNPDRCADFLKWLLDESDFQGVAAEYFLKWAPKQSVVESLPFYDEGGMKLFKDNIIANTNKGMEPAYDSLQLQVIGDALNAALYDTSISCEQLVDTMGTELNALKAAQ